MSTKTDRPSSKVTDFLSKKEGNDIVSRVQGIAIILAVVVILFVIFPFLGIH